MSAHTQDNPGPVAVARPDPRETVWNQWGPVKSFRRYVRGYLYRLPDTGWFGLTPLRTHILICGYQRAGTTLLLAMMEHALPKAKHFGEETGGWRAATYAWRNHAVVISKVPNDIFKLHRIRKFYEGRKARLRVILMVRDPRDVLTSRHVLRGPEAYFQDIAEWREYHAYYRYHKDQPDTMVLRYEDLVGDTDAVQKRIDEFTGEVSERPYKEFHKEKREDFDTIPLNGVRPVDQKTVGRWATAKHAGRIEQILREVPDFPQVLVELGYEKDEGWVERWRAGVAGAQAG